MGTAKFVISKDQAGAIIGSNGSKIKLLRSNHPDCGIRIIEPLVVTALLDESLKPWSLKQCASDRILLLSWKDDTTMHQALRAILDVFMDSSKSSAQTKIGFLFDMRPTICLVIHNGSVRSIMGNRGETIDRIREMSEAEIQIRSLNLPSLKGNQKNIDQVERIVKVGGTATQMHAALLEILRIVVDDETEIQALSDTTLPLEPCTNDHADKLVKPQLFGRYCKISIQIPDNQTGLIIGKDGSFFKHLRTTRGVTLSIDPRATDSSGQENDKDTGLPHLRTLTIGGTMISVHEAHACILGRLVSQ